MRPHFAVTCLSALAVVLAAFLPWVKLGILSATGLDGDGKFTLAMALIAAGLAFETRQRGGKLAGLGIVLMGFVVMGVAVSNVRDISGTIATVGEGLFLTQLGGIGLLIGGFMTIFGGEPKRRLPEIIASFTSLDGDRMEILRASATGQLIAQWTDKDNEVISPLSDSEAAYVEAKAGDVGPDFVHEVYKRLLESRNEDTSEKSASKIPLHPDGE